MDKIQVENRRRYLRYKPDSDYAESLGKRALESIGFVDVKMDKEQFDAAVIGMVTDKSHSGCSLMIQTSTPDQKLLVKGYACVLKAGPLAPLMAVVRWRKAWRAENLVRIGFEFTE